MNWAIKIISKTLMTKISHISWASYDKGVTTKAFTVDKNIKLLSSILSFFTLSGAYILLIKDLIKIYLLWLLLFKQDSLEIHRNNSF